tara:strand:+ start:533 stop:1174 length:642 start_codon:yes stop_codon:yes gene_type:complete
MKYIMVVQINTDILFSLLYLFSPKEVNEISLITKINKLNEKILVDKNEELKKIYEKLKEHKLLKITTQNDNINKLTEPTTFYTIIGRLMNKILDAEPVVEPAEKPVKVAIPPAAITPVGAAEPVEVEIAVGPVEIAAPAAVEPVGQVAAKEVEVEIAAKPAAIAAKAVDPAAYQDHVRSLAVTAGPAKALTALTLTALTPKAVEPVESIYHSI